MSQNIPINFSSENTPIAGTLYLPNLPVGSKAPGIVLCHGFAGIKEMLLPPYAQKFTTNGYVVLTFDYRGFGASGGEPGRLVPKLQIEDIHNAISFLSSLKQVDPNRLGLWGTSYGGANAIVAASKNQRIKCLSVQLTFGNGERCITSNMAQEELLKFKETLTKLDEKKKLTGKEMMVPVSKILSDEQSKAFFLKYADKFPALKTKIPFLTILETMNHTPENYLKDLRAPILIIGAEKDLVNPITETLSLYKLASEPKELMVVKDASHFELYEGNYFEQVINKQIAWFNTYL